MRKTFFYNFSAIILAIGILGGAVSYAAIGDLFMNTGFSLDSSQTGGSFSLNDALLDLQYPGRVHNVIKDSGEFVNNKNEAITKSVPEILNDFAFGKVPNPEHPLTPKITSVDFPKTPYTAKSVFDSVTVGRRRDIQIPSLNGSADYYQFWGPHMVVATLHGENFQLNAYVVSSDGKPTTNYLYTLSTVQSGFRSAYISPSEMLVFLTPGVGKISVRVVNPSSRPGGDVASNIGSIILINPRPQISSISQNKFTGPGIMDDPWVYITGSGFTDQTQISLAGVLYVSHGVDVNDLPCTPFTTVQNGTPVSGCRANPHKIDFQFRPKSVSLSCCGGISAGHYWDEQINPNSKQYQHPGSYPLYIAMPTSGVMQFISPTKLRFQPFAGGIIPGSYPWNTTFVSDLVVFNPCSDNSGGGVSNVVTLTTRGKAPVQEIENNWPKTHKMQEEFSKRMNAGGFGIPTMSVGVPKDKDGVRRTSEAAIPVSFNLNGYPTSPFKVVPQFSATMGSGASVVRNGGGAGISLCDNPPCIEGLYHIDVTLLYRILIDGEDETIFAPAGPLVLPSAEYLKKMTNYYGDVKKIPGQYLYQYGGEDVYYEPPLTSSAGGSALSTISP